MLTKLVKNDNVFNTNLSPDEESQMDLFSNAIIDIMLANPIKFNKTPLPYSSESNSLIVKGDVKT